MISNALRSAAEGIGFTYTAGKSAAGKSGKDSLYGVYGGYLVTLYDEGSRRTFFVNYYLDPGEEEDDSVRLLEISESLKTAFSGLSVSNYAVESDGLSCTVSGTLDDFLALLDRVLEMLVEKGVAGVTHCSCCGNKIGKRPPKKLSEQRRHFLLCEHCALDRLEAASGASAEAGVNELPKRTGMGILGAVAGGLIGILLYALIYAFLSPLFSDSSFEIRYLFCALGFATAGLIYAGFRFFSKRPCISAYVSISAVTLVSTLLGQYFGSFVGYARQMGFTLSRAMGLPSMWLIHLRSTVDKTIEYAQETLDTYNVSPLFYRLLGFSLLFALIGSVIFQLGLYEKGKYRKEPPALETLRITTPAGASDGKQPNGQESTK